jgi:SPP1 gp7 family putative phage head morphogenesis protein
LVLENKFRQKIIQLFNPYINNIINDYFKSKEKVLTITQTTLLLQIYVDEFINKYENVLIKYIKITEKLSRKHTNEYMEFLTSNKLTSNKSSIKIKPNTNVTNTLINTSKDSIKYTKANLNKNIGKILSQSETQGIGNQQVAKILRQNMKHLSEVQAERIAITEINSAHNLVTYMDLLNDEMVQYKQWITCHDKRVRRSHKHLDNEIAKIDEPFTNGLQYPGDHNGIVEEFINCRCTMVPYIMDKTVSTSKPQFQENTLEPIKVDTSKRTIETKGLKEIFTNPQNFELKLQKQPEKKEKKKQFKYRDTIKDEKQFNKIKTPEQVANYFELEYEPWIINGKNKGAKFYDKKHDTTVYVRKGLRSWEIDFQNLGRKNYNMKDLIKIYDEAPSIQKHATNTITFGPEQGKNYNALGYCISNKNKIFILKGSFNKLPSVKGNVRQTVYHEMGHALDNALNTTVKGTLNSDVIERQSESISHNQFDKVVLEEEEKYNKTHEHNNNYWNSYKKASWYGETSKQENWAETCSMAAFDKLKNKEAAIMEYAEVTRVRNKFYLNGDLKRIKYEEWIRDHEKTYQFAVKILENTTVDELNMFWK